MSRSPFFAFFLAALILLTGCSATTTQYGSAVNREERIMGIPGTSFALPEFILGEEGVHEYPVEGLSERAYPYKIWIRSRQNHSADTFLYTDWDSALVKVEVLDPNNRKVLAHKTFHPRPWKTVGSREFEHIFWSKGEPAIPAKDSYIVRVTVLDRSPRKWDQARIHLR